MSEVLKDAGNLGLIIVAVGFLLQMILPSLRWKNGAGQLEQMIKDLHRWHAPDGRGIQSWRNTELTEAIERLVASVDRLEAAVNDLTVTVTERRGP